MPIQELTEVQQIVQELCLMNNKFMNKVFENNGRLYNQLEQKIK